MSTLRNNLSIFRKPITAALFVTLSALVGFFALPSVAASEAKPATIIVLGDSLSSEYGISRGTGWVQLLRQRLEKSFKPVPTVINASISGDTTSGGLTRLPPLLAQYKPDVVIIELGGNDALRGLKLKMTEDNLTSMVRLSQKAGAAVVLAGMQIPPNYGPAYTEKFRELYPKVAKASGALLIPFLLAGLETDRSLFIEDGIHPSEAAQPLLLNNVWPSVKLALTALQFGMGKK